jgi:hypothetical protein
MLLPYFYLIFIITCLYYILLPYPCVYCFKMWNFQHQLQSYNCIWFNNIGDLYFHWVYVKILQKNVTIQMEKKSQKQQNNLE